MPLMLFDTLAPLHRVKSRNASTAETNLRLMKAESELRKVVQ
jgi:hypothetical protein